MTWVDSDSNLVAQVLNSLVARTSCPMYQSKFFPSFLALSTGNDLGLFGNEWDWVSICVMNAEIDEYLRNLKNSMVELFH